MFALGRGQAECLVLLEGTTGCSHEAIPAVKSERTSSFCYPINKGMFAEEQISLSDTPKGYSIATPRRIT